MSEQATNSPQPSAEERVSESLFKTFGGDEPQNGTKPRDPSGKFVRQGQPDQPQAPQGEAEDAAQAEAQGTEQPGQEPAQQQSEEVEVEIEGEKYVVPKKISDRFIQHADYTRKTQDLAEMRRVLSAEREAANLERAFSQSTAQERDHLALLDAQIAQYKHVNWAQLETQDLLRTRAQLDQLKEARAEVENTIKAKRGQFDEKIKSVTQEAMSAGLKYIQQHIKGYDKKIQDQLHEYGRSEGYTQEELGRIIDPRIVVSLWKASQWDALQASKPGITNRAQQAAPTVRPGATQQRPNRIQQLNQAVQKASTPKGKQQAAEEYLAARLGGGR
jgi:hypothetical protein